MYKEELAAFEHDWRDLKPITLVTWQQRIADIVTLIVVIAAAIEILNIAVQWAFKVRLF